MFGNSPATALLLALFITVDVYDGVLSRSRTMDGPGRRVLDSVVDRVAIHSVYGVAAIGGLVPAWLYGLMLARDVYCALICSQMLRERWVAIRADWLYRSFNLALATWIVAAPNIAAQSATIVLGLILAWGLAVAADLTASVEQVRRMPGSVSGIVLNATQLRHDRRG